MTVELIPRAEVVTPNVPEAEVLAGGTIRTLEDMRVAAHRIRTLGARVVVIKGGHLAGDDVVDLVVSADHEFAIRGPRIATPHTHGTGCTFAAAITAALALGQPIEEAVRGARTYVEG